MVNLTSTYEYVVVYDTGAATSYPFACFVSRNQKYLYINIILAMKNEVLDIKLTYIAHTLS